MKFNRNKFNDLVLYVCSKCKDPSVLGAVKLNKILWLTDMYSYLFTGKPMTGETYIKRQLGPVPYHILHAIDDLVSKGIIAIRDVDHFGYDKKEYIALQHPNLSRFNAEEISIVDRLIDKVCYDHTAKSISLKTHDKIWELAEIGEELPYYTIFASVLGEINEVDMEWALQESTKAA